MSKLEKLIEKLLIYPPELSYNEVYYILTQFGFQEVSNEGSHHTFRNDKKQKNTIPKKGGKTV
ncbi:MAG: type II toxin-antitoxin system HicA family toxin, partial [Crocosphaera sp.]